MAAIESLAGQLKTSPKFTGGQRHELEFETIPFAGNRHDSES